MEATVADRGAEPYDVAITVANGRRTAVQVVCSCPMSFNCKHVAAVLYARGDLSGRPRVVPVRDPLAGPAGAWLKRLADAAKSTAGGAGRPSGCLYILDVQDKGAGPALRISAQLSRPKKSGGFGKGPRRGARTDGTAWWHPRRSDRKDHIIFQLLRAGSPYFSAGCRPTRR